MKGKYTNQKTNLNKFQVKNFREKKLSTRSTDGWVSNFARVIGVVVGVCGWNKFSSEITN